MELLITSEVVGQQERNSEKKCHRESKLQEDQNYRKDKKNYLSAAGDTGVGNVVMHDPDDCPG